MGENKHIIKLIKGQLRTITNLQAKIEAELEKPVPNTDSIRGGKEKLTTREEE
ncbi:MAG TPA: hypothetical protein VFD30_11120 [Terriglobia bacterium]|jgi:hypothetical protein|nr:hypothetical protein [Terriglobia bacterium]